MSGQLHYVLSACLMLPVAVNMCLFKTALFCPITANNNCTLDSESLNFATSLGSALEETIYNVVSHFIKGGGENFNEFNP